MMKEIFLILINYYDKISLIRIEIIFIKINLKKILILNKKLRLRMHTSINFDTLLTALLKIDLPPIFVLGTFMLNNIQIKFITSVI